MRIIAGQYRGRRLASLGKGDAGAHLRPTADRVRESLFSILTHMDVIAGAHVLDLFAGTGALGLEALSRGARYVTFVETGRVGVKLIADNVALLGAGEQVQLLRRDATRLGPCELGLFDLVFLDPPYGKGLGSKALAAAVTGSWLAPGACVVWEESTAQPAPDGFDTEGTRRFGDTAVTLLRWRGGP